jgi:hypothetical protein
MNVCNCDDHKQHGVLDADRVYRAPINPADLIKADQLRHYDASEVLIVTTGSQVHTRTGHMHIPWVYLRSDARFSASS